MHDVTASEARAAVIFVLPFFVFLLHFSSTPILLRNIPMSEPECIALKSDLLSTFCEGTCPTHEEEEHI